MVLSDEYLSGYQNRDREVIDYCMYELGDTGLMFRGPEIDTNGGDYFSCIGAAQTFGCFCQSPYPSILSSQLSLPALNLGYGGAGPRFFNRHPKLIEYANGGRFVVVQVMSARSEDNSSFESNGWELLTRRSDGRRMSAFVAWDSILESRYLWRRLPVGRSLAKRASRSVGRWRARRLVAETRRNWCASFETLLGQLTKPVILLWFSRRTPHYRESYARTLDLFGEFPQLVNAPMVADIRRTAPHYVEAVSNRGYPQALSSRHDGRPVTVNLEDDRAEFAGQVWSHNIGYPSPEMHQDAADALMVKCQEAMARQTKPYK